MNQKRLLIAFSITGLMTIVEVVGGVLSNSIALISDAAHMLTDTLALGLSILALHLARRPANERKTYGYFRAEILSAMANGIILILISAYIFYEVYQRFNDPPEVRGGLMLIVAVIGLLANIIGISILRSASHGSLNVRGAYLHMWGDTLSSAGVIIGGIVILVAGWHYADPLVSILIGLLIIKGAAGLIWESGNILLEGVPSNIDIGDVIDTILDVQGVNAVHDLHLWTITSGIHAMSCHIVLDDRMISQGSDIVGEISSLVKRRYNIEHSTLQLECSPSAPHEVETGTIYDR